MRWADQVPELTLPVRRLPGVERYEKKLCPGSALSRPRLTLKMTRNGCGRLSYPLLERHGRYN